MSDFTSRIVQDAFRNLINRIPAAERADAECEWDIDVLGTALILLAQHEQTIGSINNATYHHAEESRRLVDRLAERAPAPKRMRKEKQA